MIFVLVFGEKFYEIVKDSSIFIFYFVFVFCIFLIIIMGIVGIFLIVEVVKRFFYILLNSFLLIRYKIIRFICERVNYIFFLVY